MNDLKTYLLAVISGAMLIGLLNRWVGKRHTSGAIIQIAGSIFLLLTIVQPLTRFDFSVLASIPETVISQSAQIAEGGIAMAADLQTQSISESLAAYVLKKADGLGLQITLDIQLGAAPAFLPESITIYGFASPYAKAQLQEILSNDLGIPKEKQLWIS